MRARSLSFNFAILSLGQIVSRLLTFVVILHLTHALSVDHFGIITFATNVLLYAGLIVDCGFDSLGPLEVARGTVPLPTLVRTVISFRLLLVGPAFAALILFAWLAPITDLTKKVVFLYGVSLLFNALDCGWVFFGAERMGPVALADVFSQSFVTLGAFFLIRAPDHVLRMPFIALGGRVIMVTVLALLFVRHFGRWAFGIDRPLLKRLLTSALPFSGTAVIGALLNNCDIILLGVWRGSEAAGLYGAVYRLVWLPTMLMAAYYVALRPLLARASTKGLHTIAPLLQFSMQLMVAFGIGIAVGGIILAAPLIELLYGPAYQPAVWALRILLSSFALLVVSRHYRLLLVAFAHQATDFRLMLAAALLNVILNVLLIAPFGMDGAALATLASESLLLVGIVIATRWHLGTPLLGHTFLKTAVCAGGMALVLLLTSSWSILSRLVLGSVVYIGLLILFRIISLAEIRHVLSTDGSLRSMAGEPRLR